MKPYDLIFDDTKPIPHHIHEKILPASGWWELTIWDELYEEYTNTRVSDEDIMRMVAAIRYYS